MPLFGASQEELEAANWETVKTLISTAQMSQGDTQVLLALETQLNEINGQVSTPREWGSRLAGLLIELNKQVLDRDQTIKGQDYRLRKCHQRCEAFEKYMDNYIRRGVEERTEELAASEQKLRDRIDELRGALRATQQAHRIEITKLEAKVAGLRRIVVEQEEALIDAEDGR